MATNRPGSSGRLIDVVREALERSPTRRTATRTTQWLRSHTPPGIPIPAKGGARPTAVYAVSGKSAIGAYRAIAEAGLRIPDDISVVGTDDVVQTAINQDSRPGAVRRSCGPLRATGRVDQDTDPGLRGRRDPHRSVDLRAVRAWAASNGVDVSSRGRVPASVIEQYQAAGN